MSEDRVERSPLSSIAREEELKGSAARGCNKFSARARVGDLGQALAKSLLKTAECPSALLLHRQ
eukprot:4712568-Pyramimonas_sp.AAC.1